MDHYKLRTLERKPELRDNRRLCFYAAVFDQETTVFDYLPGSKERTAFSEVVRRGAFSESLSGGDIEANVDHDSGRAFGKQSTGLLLQEDNHGLFATYFLPQGGIGDEIIAGVEAGKITGASFRSRIVDGGDVWDGKKLQVVNAPLVDVCVTGKPAYKGTDVKLRMIEANYADLFRRLRILKLRS